MLRRCSQDRLRWYRRRSTAPWKGCEGGCSGGVLKPTAGVCGLFALWTRLGQVSLNKYHIHARCLMISRTVQRHAFDECTVDLEMLVR